MGIFNVPTPPTPYWDYAILNFPSKFCDPPHPLPPSATPPPPTIESPNQNLNF